jgi:prepilin-type N-terminal cleavage/methylation domain-containing protein
MDRLAHRRLTLNERGMTLTELVFAMAIFSFFAIVTLSSVSAVTKMNAKDVNDRELLNEARIVMERIIWGPKVDGETTRDGVVEAEDYSITNSTFQYTLPDGDNRRIVRSQDELTFHKPGEQVTLYDPNGEGNPPEPQNYSTSLTFTEVEENILRIDLVLGKLKNGRWYYASLSTRVALRN